MERCHNKKNLLVHHKRKNGGNGLENAEVLCPVCLEHNSLFKENESELEPFPIEIKVIAVVRAGNQCECTRIRCKSH